MQNKAFSLIELLVVIGVILTLSIFIFPEYRTGEKQFALQRSAHKLIQDIRRAEEMAMSARKYACPTGTMQGYGVNFFRAAKEYSLSAQCDLSYNIETVQFEKGVIIKDLAYYLAGEWQIDRASLWFYFVPPQPQVSMMSGAEKVRITLSLEIDPDKTEVIIINSAGLVNIE